MSEFSAPVRDMQFVIEELIGLEEINTLPGFEDATPDVVRAILDEAGKLASEILAPINKTGDTEGSRLENGVVITPTGFQEAYKAYVGHAPKKTETITAYPARKYLQPGESMISQITSFIWSSRERPTPLLEQGEFLCLLCPST